MEVLRNKRYETYDYTCRYTSVPYYYHTVDERDFYGLGTNMKKNFSWVAHEIKPGDSLDYLALKYYANPSYWWVIAYANDLQDPFVKLNKYKFLKIPQISGIQFGAERK